MLNGVSNQGRCFVHCIFDFSAASQANLSSTDLYRGIYMRLLGYVVSTIAGWFLWQCSLILGYNIQENDGPYILQVVFIFGSLPVGMSAGASIAWLWFRLIPSAASISESRHSQTAGLLSVVAALSSCAWFSVSFDQPPNPILFFPLESGME